MGWDGNTPLGLDDLWRLYHFMGNTFRSTINSSTDELPVSQLDTPNWKRALLALPPVVGVIPSSVERNNAGWPVRG